MAAMAGKYTGEGGAGVTHAVVAVWVLAAAEAVFWPGGELLLLVPLILLTPGMWPRYAASAALGSVSGGVVACLLGRYGIFPWIRRMPLPPWTLRLLGAGARHALPATVVGSLLPVPYKVIAWGYGAGGGPVGPFLLGSVLGRSLRYGLVALVVVRGGPGLIRAAALRPHWLLIGAGALALALLLGLWRLRASR